MPPRWSSRGRCRWTCRVERRSRSLAPAFLLAGLGLDLAGVATVLAHRTTIVPHRPVAKLITTGIYRISRNPMDAGLAIMVAGGALLTGAWWPLLTLPLALVAVTQLAIKPEEDLPGRALRLHL